MSSTIKWLRLREICEAIVEDRLHEQVEIELHASTEMPESIRSAVERHNGKVAILVNLLYNKSLEDVARSIAHELTHVLLKSDRCDTKRFHRMMPKVMREIIGRYNKEGCSEKRD